MELAKRADGDALHLEGLGIRNLMRRADWRIAQRFGENIVEPALENLQRFRRAIDVDELLLGMPEAAQIIDSMCVVGMIVRVKNAIYVTDMGG